MDAEIAGPERVNAGNRVHSPSSEHQKLGAHPMVSRADALRYLSLTPPLLLQDIVWKIGLLPLVYLCAYFTFTCYFTRCGSSGRVHQPYFVVFGLLLLNVM